MSANRDKSQKVTFLYSNLYQIYKDRKPADPSAIEPVSTAPTSGVVLKTGDVKEEARQSVIQEFKNGVTVRAYQPVELLNKRIEETRVQPVMAAPIPQAVTDPTLESLKTNLKTLNDLHQRLRFMLQELEELTKE